MWNLVFFIVLLISLVNCQEDYPAETDEQPKFTENDTIVRTSLGIMKGYIIHTRDGRKVSAFTSIPYAVPPVQKLRFKAPVPSGPWGGVLDAARTTPVCVSRNPYTRDPSIVGQEDCLYLNVYVPHDKLYEEVPFNKTKQLLPVMFFIHGGGLMCGDSQAKSYGPEFLLDRDVILVTTNYRLGPLGFLSTMDEHCPGNNGMKDQQLALKWVQQHIINFSGDPRRVTIFGESAGGASVHFHMIADSSKGLFHGAISESGAALAPWVAPYPGEAARHAILLAKFLDCPSAPSEKMLQCLRTKEAHDIIATDVKFYAWDYEAMTPFKTVVEPEGPGAFLTQDPRSAVWKTDVPWLTGLNKDEGLLKSLWITMIDNLLDEYITGFEAIAPVTFYYENSLNTQDITHKIKEFYHLNTSREHLKCVDNNITRAYSDSYFNYPMLESVELTLHSPARKPVYLYQLNYEASNSFSTIFGDPSNENHGVCHADELMHLFPIYFLKSPISESDVAISHMFVTLWTNFATTGNPNLPKKLPVTWWPVQSASTMEYLKIDIIPEMGRNIAERSKFWSKLPIRRVQMSKRTKSDEL